jgi:MFS family permease
MDTSFLSNLNWLAILCGALAYFMLGALWYSKALFALPWLRFVKIDPNNEDAKKGMAAIMLASFVFMFLISFGIAVLKTKSGLAGGWMSGIKLGFFVGLFFGATAISISYLYEKRPTGLHLINGGYTIVGSILSAIIICSWP